MLPSCCVIVAKAPSAGPTKSDKRMSRLLPCLVIASYVRCFGITVQPPVSLLSAFFFVALPHFSGGAVLSWLQHLKSEKKDKLITTPPYDV